MIREYLHQNRDEKMKIHGPVLISIVCLLLSTLVFARGGGFRGGPPPHRGFQSHGNHHHSHSGHHRYHQRHHNDDYRHGLGREYRNNHEGYGGNMKNWGNDDPW